MSLDLVKNYNKVLSAIKVNASLIKVKERELSRLIYPTGKYKSPSFGPSNSSGSSNPKNDPPLEYYSKVIALTSEVQEAKNHQDFLKEEKRRLDKEIEEIANKCNDVEVSLFYYHYIKSLTLIECSKIMKYSYGNIKKIHMKLLKA